MSNRDRGGSLDVRFADMGSLYLMTPLTDRAKAWVEENVSIEPYSRLGASVAVEPRCVPDLVDGMAADGLVCGDCAAEIADRTP